MQMGTAHRIGAAAMAAMLAGFAVACGPSTPDAPQADAPSAPPAALAGPEPQPLPLDTPSPLPVNEERFFCPGDVTMVIRFQAMPDLAAISLGGEGYQLPIAVSGSGYRYTDGAVELTGKGDEARLKRPGQTELVCGRAAAATPPPP